MFLEMHDFDFAQISSKSNQFAPIKSILPKKLLVGDAAALVVYNGHLALLRKIAPFVSVFNNWSSSVWHKLI